MTRDVHLWAFLSYRMTVVPRGARNPREVQVSETAPLVVRSVDVDAAPAALRVERPSGHVVVRGFEGRPWSPWRRAPDPGAAADFVRRAALPGGPEALGVFSPARLADGTRPRDEVLDGVREVAFDGREAALAEARRKADAVLFVGGGVYMARGAPRVVVRRNFAAYSASSRLGVEMQECPGGALDPATSCAFSVERAEEALEFARSLGHGGIEPQVDLPPFEILDPEIVRRDDLRLEAENLVAALARPLAGGVGYLSEDTLASYLEARRLARDGLPPGSEEAWQTVHDLCQALSASATADRKGCHSEARAALSAIHDRIWLHGRRNAAVEIPRLAAQADMSGLETSP